MRWISKVHSREFVCFLHFIGLDNISLGVHVNWLCPNVEIHLPFCYIRIGWAVVHHYTDGPWRSFGRVPKWRRE